MSKLVSVLCALSLVTLIGCGDSGGDPTATVLNLIPYNAVSGSLEVEVDADMPSGVKRVELFAGLEAEPMAVAKEAPYKLSWDTTAIRDGLTNVAVTVIGNDGESHHSDILPVIVLNLGERGAFIDGDAGVMQIGSDPAGDYHMPHHWEMPSGVKQMMALVKWVGQDGQAAWDMEIALGQGVCPHRGKQYGERAHSTETPTVNIIGADQLLPAADFLPETPAVYDAATELYFAHVAALNPAEHLTEGLPYSLEIYLLR
jgi:hypothetical protein